MIMVDVDKQELEHVLTALVRVRSATSHHGRNLPRRFAIIAVLELKKNILAQTYGDFGHAFADHYSKLKDRKGSTSYWNLTGALLDSLSYRKIYSTEGVNAWFAGVPKNARNGSKRINDYAFALE